jgi:predicted enzyme related to lactoylglutathione lyase
MDVMTAGRMGVFQDAQGAFISVWQPRDHIGAAKVNEPGAYCWNELMSRDPEGAKPFYRDVFGWGAITHAGGPMPYTEFQLGGQSIAGMAPMAPQIPAAVPPHWLVYFAVADTDATIARAQELGGAVRVPPMDIPTGRFAVLADPQGATFGVIALAAG